MKNIGQQAAEFRTGKNWSTKQMASEVDKRHRGEKPVRRQHIEQLEKAGDRLPGYLLALAGVMGTTADVLLSGKFESPKVEEAGSQPDELPNTQTDWRNEFFEELRKLARVKRRIAIAILPELIESPEDEELQREFRDLFNQAPPARVDASINPLEAGETRESESMNKGRRGDSNGDRVQIPGSKKS